MVDPPRPIEQTPVPRLLSGLPSWLLSQAGVRAHRLLADALTAVGARGHEVRVLVALREVDGVTQAMLGRSTRLDRSDVTAAIDDLERAGHVRRTPDPADRRIKRVQITPTGRARCAELEHVVDAAQEEILLHLTNSEREQLVDLLRRLQP